MWYAMQFSRADNHLIWCWTNLGLHIVMWENSWWKEQTQTSWSWLWRQPQLAFVGTRLTVKSLWHQSVSKPVGNPRWQDVALSTGNSLKLDFYLFILFNALSGAAIHTLGHTGGHTQSNARQLDGTNSHWVWGKCRHFPGHSGYHGRHNHGAAFLTALSRAFLSRNFHITVDANRWGLSVLLTF